MLDGVHFDPTVKLGDVLTLVGFFGVGITAFVNIKSTLKFFGLRLDIIDASVEDLQRDFGNAKVQDNRLDRLEKDTERNAQQIFEMQRGQGFIQREVSGPYSRTGKTTE